MGNHLSGRIESFDLVDLIQWLEVRRVSGRLTAFRGEDRRTIDWKDGDIVYVSGGRAADRLGYALLRSKAISISALYAALAENLALGEKLTRVLLQRDLISRDRLAGVVESLARRLLREVLAWRRGRFEFDPTFQAEEVLQIHLKIKGQVVAFHAVKDIDETARAARDSAEENEGDNWEQEFRPEAVEEAFWAARGRAQEEIDFSHERERFFRFRDFAEAVHRRLAAPLGFLPVYGDSARLSTEILEAPESDETDQRLLSLLLLDPFFTLNLLHLANSLATGAIRRIVTAREALHRIGSVAFRRFIECLSGPTCAKLSESDPIPRVLRRASLAAALAAAQLAPGRGIDPEEAYGAGLLHAIPYADLLAAIGAAPMPAGAFRAAALESLRPIVGRVRSESWRLSPELAQVLADAGGKNPSALVSIVREARSELPECSLGPVPPPARKKAAARSGIRFEVKRTFAFLNLGEP